MTAVTFDTLKFAKRLEAAGLLRSLAEAIADAFREATSDELATKADLREREYRLVIKLGATSRIGAAAAVALAGVLVKLL